MRDVSDNWHVSAEAGAHLLARLECIPPVGDPFQATLVSGSVDQSDGIGGRWSATISIAPQVGEDTWEKVSWPGCEFKLQIGMWHGATSRDLINYGTYVHDDDPTYDLYGDGTIELHLADKWADVKRAHYDEETLPRQGPRIIVVERAIRQALGQDQPVSVRVDTDFGGDWDGGKTDKDNPAQGWTERSEMIEDMCADGGFVAYFDYDGVFVIDREPNINASAVMGFRDGPSGNIVEYSRGGRFTEYYNRVAVFPDAGDGEDAVTQNWNTQTATLDEPNHPLDPRNMNGLLVPYSYGSKTITREDQARARARRLLIRVLRQQLERDLTSYNAAILEMGDVVTVSLQATETEPRVTERWMVTKLSYDLITGDTSMGLANPTLPVLRDSGQATVRAAELPSMTTTASTGLVAGVGSRTPGGTLPGGGVILSMPIRTVDDDG